MATRITYKFNGKAKEINFAYDKFHDIYEAVAAAEGVDLTRYLMMEQQVETTSKGSSAVRDFRNKEFARFGFSDIYYIKDDPKAR
ncbi:MAG: putative transcriptional regulator [Shewanella sp.]|jgi:predicted transcriptional regulator